jgi:hypothetical protein
VSRPFSIRKERGYETTEHPRDRRFGRWRPVLAELRSERAQARSQALHTLSKLKDSSAWPVITRSLLSDRDDEVARRHGVPPSSSCRRAGEGLVSCQPAGSRELSEADANIDGNKDTKASRGPKEFVFCSQHPFGGQLLLKQLPPNTGSLTPTGRRDHRPVFL